MRKIKQSKKREVKINTPQKMAVYTEKMPLDVVKKQVREKVNKSQVALLIQLAIECMKKHRTCWDQADAWATSQMKARLTRAIKAFEKWFVNSDLVPYMNEHLEKEYQEKEKKQLIDALVRSSSKEIYQFEGNDRMIICTLEWAIILLSSFKTRETKLRIERALNKNEYNKALKSFSDYYNFFTNDIDLHFTEAGKTVGILL